MNQIEWIIREIESIKKRVNILSNLESKDKYNIWIPIYQTASYVSATSVSISGIDLTAYLKNYIKCRFYQSGWKYGYIASSSLSSGNTTAVFVANTSYSVANAAIDYFEISYSNPPDFPTQMNYTPVLSAASGILDSASASGTFAINGRLLALNLTITITTNGTASGAIFATIPKPPVTVTIINGRENAITGSMLQGFLDGNTTMSIFKYDGGYPSGNGYQIYMSGTYAV